MKIRLKKFVFQYIEYGKTLISEQSRTNFINNIFPSNFLNIVITNNNR